MPDSAARRRTIRDLLSRDSVTSQADLLARLRARGYSVTQATVSRDLQALGAEKQRGRYSLVSKRQVASDGVSRILSGYVNSITASGNLVVLKTPPGAAQMVAAALDGAGLDGVLGTVAGDDTVLVVASEPATGSGLKHKLEEIGAAR
jgi:transcriptional regulator of arginine metabolism